MRSRRNIWLILAFLALVLSAFAPMASRAAGPPKVYVIDVHGMVWPGQAQFVENALNEAAQNGASAVILDVDSPGGYLAAAVDIKKAIISHDHDFPTVGYSHSMAASSAALITLSCKYIAMAPTATLGTAQPHPDLSGGEPDPEELSYARAVFRSTAEFRGRNPNIAMAWVTSPDAIPSLGVKPGDILSMDVPQAQKNGFCDLVANDYPDILAFLHLSGAEIVPEHLDFWHEAAIWIADPWVTILLLGLGMALVIIELLTLHSWGIAGVTGGVVVGIVLLAHIVAGTASWLGIILLLAGIGLLLFETHLLPGHGLAALAGLVCIFLGIFWALGGSQGNALFPTLMSIIVTLGIIISFFIYLPRSRVWRILGQNMQQKAALGYVATSDFTGYLGQRGIAVTLLRPSGSADVEGMRLNVVTEGAFLPAGTPVEVVKVQGNRIVVRETQGASSKTETPSGA
jgi:membrane-bound serine protease (ClpP class)